MAHIYYVLSAVHQETNIETHWTVLACDKYISHVILFSSMLHTLAGKGKQNFTKHNDLPYFFFLYLDFQNGEVSVYCSQVQDPGGMHRFTIQISC